MKVWHKIDRHLHPELNRLVKLKIGGKSICLVNNEGNLHATSGRCPHAGADLSQGWCEANRLVCPYHRHTFDLETGRGADGQGNYIQIYPLTWKDEELFIELPGSWWPKFLRS